MLTKIVNGETVVMSAEEEAEITNEWNTNIQQRALYDSTQGYRDSRRDVYPSIGDQLDMLWHAMDSGEIPKCTAFYSAIQNIKNKYPKA